MKELNEYREKLIERVAETALEFGKACTAVKDPFTKVDGEWTLHQVASHTRDVDKFVYGARILRTLNEDKPTFEGFDADTWMAAHYNKEEPIAAIVDEIASNVEKLCNTLRAAPREAWSRESSHKTMGDGLTLQLWVERSLAHIEEHLDAVKTIQN